MKIGIIGSGEMGSVLASKFVQSGHRVSIANSRGAESLKQFTTEIGAQASTVEEVISNNQVVIVSIPQKNVPDLPKQLFKTLRKDVIVIDTGNYYPGLRDGSIPELEKTGIDSLWVQDQLGIPVIKIFNSILATSLKDFGRLKGQIDRNALAVSGDNAKAKETAFQLVEELGFDPYDMGNIEHSWRQQPGSPIYCRDINLEEMKRRVATMETNPSDMHKIINTNRQTDEKLMKSDYPAYLKTLI